MIPEEVKNKIKAADKDPRNPYRKDFITTAEFGYGLASAEIEALKGEVKRLKGLLQKVYIEGCTSVNHLCGDRIAEAKKEAEKQWQQFSQNNNI